MKRLLFLAIISVFVTSCGTTSLLEQNAEQIEKLGFCCVIAKVQRENLVTFDCVSVQDTATYTGIIRKTENKTFFDFVRK